MYFSSSILNAEFLPAWPSRAPECVGKLAASVVTKKHSFIVHAPPFAAGLLGEWPRVTLQNSAELVGTVGPGAIYINDLAAAGKLRTKGSWVQFLPAAPYG